MESLKRTLDKRDSAPTAKELKEIFERLRQPEIQRKLTPAPTNKEGSQCSDTEAQAAANVKQLAQQNKDIIKKNKAEEEKSKNG